MARQIAAQIIKERARESEQRGQLIIAEQLRHLASGLQAQQITLTDAALVVQIALAGNASSTPATSHRPVENPVSAAQVTAILDGDLTATTPPPTTSEPTTSEPLPTPVETLGTTPVEVNPPITVPKPQIPVATSVITASRVGEDKTMLVMIGAGDDQQVKMGQRFIVKRNDQQIAVISATQVKPNMTICIAIAGTIANEETIKAGDVVVSE